MRMLALALAALALVAVATPARAERCGHERAAVKLGTDPDAARVALAPVDVTIADLVALPRPRTVPGDRRAGAVELTTYRVHATIVAVRAEDDGDLHIVISDGTRTMIVEVPSVDCAARSAWRDQIAAARAAAQRLRPGRRTRQLAIPVVVTGVAFFDFVHGQLGVAPSGVELHPVLAIELPGAR